MMELSTCAFVLTFVSLVAASPYGYGVKGGAGASARAASIASAGAFGDRGDIPAGIPFGNGFSGSFSKSSASSSSSSSASSSASSFSYSSSGAGGFSGQGCGGASGGCQSSGANDISANHETNDASLHGSNGANSAAVAGSGAVSGANCQGPTCDNSGEKCSTGLCSPKSQSGSSPSTYNANNKCSSGQCGLSSPSAQPYDDSDDIRFVGHSSKAAQGAKDESSSHDKSTGYHTGSDCSGGKCGPTSYSQPIYSQGPDNSYQNTKPSTNLNLGSTPSYPIPATDLEAPKQDSDCSSGICNGKQGYSPSSYNSPTQKTTCYDGNCANPQKGSYSSTPTNSLSTNYLSPQDSKGSSYYQPSSTNCVGSNCSPSSSNQISDKPPVTGPTNIHPGTGPSCSAPNCNPYGSASTGPNARPGYINPTGPADNIKQSHDKLPTYTGGFGAPAGLFKPNEYNPVTGTTNGPSHGHPSTSVQNQPTLESTPTGCSTPNCIGQVTSPGINSQPAPFGNNAPSGDLHGQKLPTYTGGFGGPAGMLKPNEYNSGLVTKKPTNSIGPTYSAPTSSPTGCNTPNCIVSPVTGVTSASSVQSGSYGINKEQSGSVTVTDDKLPAYTGGFGGPAGMLKPNDFNLQATNTPLLSTNPSYNSPLPSLPTTGCKTPNCNTFTPGAGPATNTQSGSYGVTKPSTGIDSSSELPPYTGGFGGPAGVLKPNEFDVSHTAPNTHKPSYSGVAPNKSPANNNLPNCATPDCSPSIGNTIGAHVQPPFSVTKPSYVPHQLSVTPGYTTNYNRPVGVTHPSAPAVAPISPGYTPPLQPTTGAYTGGCKTGNCPTYPTDGVSSHDHTPTGSYGSSNPNTSSKPQYTNGYGGSSGAVTPSDNLYNVPSSGSGTDNCKTANCANLPVPSGADVGSNQQIPGYTSGFAAPSLSNPTAGANPIGHIKPSSDSSNQGGCSTGTCNPKESSPGFSAASGGAHASSAASANAVVYTGGFGGPPGYLKPYDEGKVDLTKIANGLNPESHFGGGNIPLSYGTKPGTSGTPFDAHANIAGSVAGSTAFTGSLASSGSGYITPGAHHAAHGVKGGSPCGGGCGGAHQGGLTGSGSLSSAASFASAGSFAGSSASAHSSAGAYTKGGYGKR